MAQFMICLVIFTVVAGAFVSGYSVNCPCPREQVYNPVCDSDARVVRTSLCHAVRCFGTKISDVRPPECCAEIQMCTLEYSPVCGDGVEYGNLCEAKCSGVSILYPGKCGEFDPSSCNCPPIHHPVCGSSGIMFKNECLAECAGATVVARRRCPVPYGGYSLED